MAQGGISRCVCQCRCVRVCVSVCMYVCEMEYLRWTGQLLAQGGMEQCVCMCVWGGRRGEGVCVCVRERERERERECIYYVTECVYNICNTECVYMLCNRDCVFIYYVTESVCVYTYIPCNRVSLLSTNTFYSPSQISAHPAHTLAFPSKSTASQAQYNHT